jgi:L-alanine-DL-glutamate epimerase-like enolase superfamily enzyme
MIDPAGMGFVQIDAGRIGGITTAARVAAYARERSVRFVNHTFTTHLALSASLQASAGHKGDAFCEYPFAPSALARDFTIGGLPVDAEGCVRVPEAPGLGVTPNAAALKPYLVDVEIQVAGQVLCSSPAASW